jgi:hypothetical protein
MPEDTARLIDAEVKRIMTDATARLDGAHREARPPREGNAPAASTSKSWKARELRAILGVPQPPPHHT